jgi:hypothetical protein
MISLQRRLTISALCAGLSTLAAGAVFAQQWRLSPDTTVAVDTGVVGDGDIAAFDEGGSASASTPGLAPEADLVGYHDSGDEGRILVLDIATHIDGVFHRAGEPFVHTAAGTSALLDLRTLGVPRGIEVDAVTRLGDGSLVVSFDATMEVGGDVFADEDLVRVDGNQLLMLVDGSESGIAASLDVDGAHWGADGRWHVSFDTAGEVGGVSFSAADVLVLNPESGAWSLGFSPADSIARWRNTDTDAIWLREPGRLQWARSTVLAREDSGSVALELSRVDGDDGSVSVSWQTVPDSAQADIDFTSASGTAVLGDGVTGVTVSVELLDDELSEGPERLFVDLVSVGSGGGSLGTPTRLELRIRDDEDYVFADGFESSP